MSSRLMDEYVKRATTGRGFASWQSKNVPSDLEIKFRLNVERRKTRMLKNRVRVRHPTLLGTEELDRARRNIRKANWAREWHTQQKRTADFIVRQPDGYVDAMLEEGTPWIGYSFICPNCCGVKSFPGVEYTTIQWEYQKPDQITCTACGHRYPSRKHPETFELLCPRMGRSLMFYENDDQRAHPRDRSGKRAWRYSNTPIDVCFSGIIRERKASFMMDSARSLALMYRLEGDPRYAERVVEILLRLTHVFRNEWLYHDWRNTVADCDPLFASWHDQMLPLEFKRNVFTYTYEKDTMNSAAMQVTYWGAGRFLTSTGGAHYAAELCLAYDLVYRARDRNGRPLWTPELRERVERDLFLEWMIEAEPFLGGKGKAECVNNKSPRVYNSMAAVGKCLGITEFADVALRGYEAIRDESFGFDGFSHETPTYNDMYLQLLLGVAETLRGFRFPRSYKKQEGRGRVDLFKDDPKLRLMLRALIDERRPDGRLLTLGDSFHSHIRMPSGSIPLEIGMNRYPDDFGDRIAKLYRHRGSKPTEYAVFHLDAKMFEKRIDKGAGLDLPEIYFPRWMNAMLRHGEGMRATVLSLGSHPPGAHRHYDNLSLFYEDRGRIMLGDHGYLAEAPMQRWVKHTFSHNLVIVDDEQQRFFTGKPRVPEFRMMVMSPKVSVVEAASDVYSQCGVFRRLVAMIKGPGAETFAVDVYRVRGGDKHDYRIFSEVASSDSGRTGRLDFQGIQMPRQRPLPKVGASQEEKDIFGLRDPLRRRAAKAGWNATWSEKGQRFRMWMLSDSDVVQCANGPGQEMLGNIDHVGRRLRYVDVVNRGKELDSTFVAVHEPSGPRGAMPITKAQRIKLPKRAGPNAVAIKVESRWGTYLIFSECRSEVESDGVRFKGRFGIFCRKGEQPWILTAGAETMASDGFGFEGAAASWSGQVEESTESTLTVNTPRPRGWTDPPDGVGQYVRVKTREYWTGFPLVRTGDRKIMTSRFPLQPSTRFELLEVRYNR